MKTIDTKRIECVRGAFGFDCIEFYPAKWFPYQRPEESILHLTMCPTWGSFVVPTEAVVAKGLCHVPFLRGHHVGIPWFQTWGRIYKTSLRIFRNEIVDDEWMLENNHNFVPDDFLNLVEIFQDRGQHSHIEYHLVGHALMTQNQTAEYVEKIGKQKV